MTHAYESRRVWLSAASVIAFGLFAFPVDSAQAQSVRAGDVLLGVNYEDFSDRTQLPYYYGGVRHAAVYDGSSVIEGGVAWSWHNWWPRGTIRSTALSSFKNRYDLVLVYRSSSNAPSGSDIASGANVMRRYFGGYLSCVELVEYARYLGGGRYTRYRYPSEIMYSNDFYYATYLR